MVNRTPSTPYRLTHRTLIIVQLLLLHLSPLQFQSHLLASTILDSTHFLVTNLTLFKNCSLAWCFSGIVQSMFFKLVKLGKLSFWVGVYFLWKKTFLVKTWIRKIFNINQPIALSPREQNWQNSLNKSLLFQWKVVYIHLSLSNLNVKGIEFLYLRGFELKSFKNIEVRIYTILEVIKQIHYVNKQRSKCSGNHLAYYYFMM